VQAQHCVESVAVNVSLRYPGEQRHPTVPVHLPVEVVQGPALTGRGATVSFGAGGDGGMGAAPSATPSQPLEPPPVPQHCTNPFDEIVVGTGQLLQ
jgi:hypothetical protein